MPPKIDFPALIKQDYAASLKLSLKGMKSDTKEAAEELERARKDKSYRFTSQDKEEIAALLADIQQISRPLVQSFVQ